VAGVPASDPRRRTPGSARPEPGSARFPGVPRTEPRPPGSPIPGPGKKKCRSAGTLLRSPSSRRSRRVRPASRSPGDDRVGAIREAIKARAFSGFAGQVEAQPFPKAGSGPGLRNSIL
jgi:hypothetical protein